jgi:lysine N6-hydroxylase
MTRHHDVVAVGCGPFNLGLAALAATVDELDLVVLESQPELRWHPGLMFDDAMLQVSFLADLVTLVAPTHPLSFLSYLHAADRMYPFYIRERFHPTRREYEDYLRWAAERLPAVHFGHHVEAVRAEHDRYVVEIRRGDGTRTRVTADTLVLGIGTEPAVPAALAGLPEHRLLHSSGYLHRIPDVTAARRVTVVGSGQSGGEVALDLLRRNLDGGPAVSWLTRTASFAPLDYTRLVLEMTTPGYVRYFHSLPPARREELVAEQWRHYKGLSAGTLEQIHDLLYQRELVPGLAEVELRNGVSVESATEARGRVRLCCGHRDTGRRFEHETDLVVAATGYRQRQPAFLAPVEPLLRRDGRDRYRVRLDHSLELDPAAPGRIFVANADLHSHGVAAPDLGIGAVRNATILNAICGREVYRLPRHTAYTRFPAPDGGTAP